MLLGNLAATYGPINNSQNNPFLQGFLNDSNAGNLFVSTDTVPDSGNPDSPSAGNPIVTINPINGNGNYPRWGAWSYGYTFRKHGPHQYSVYFADPQSEGYVTIYFATDPNVAGPQNNDNPGPYSEKVLPIVDPSKQVYWTGGPPGNAAYAPAVAFLGAVLTAGIAAYAAAAAGAVQTGAAAASTSGVTTAATDFSLIPGASSGIGVTVPGAIAAPVSSLSTVAGGQGLVAAGTALPAIGAGAVGSGIVIPASLTTPVTSLADVAGGQGLVAVSQGAATPLPPSTGYQGVQVPQAPVSTPAVSSPIPSQQSAIDSLKNLPTNTVQSPATSAGSQLQTGATNQLLNTVAKQIGTVIAGGGAAAGAINARSPGYAVNPITGIQPGMLNPTPTGGVSTPSGVAVAGSAGGSVQGTLAGMGIGGLLLGFGALYFLTKKRR